MPMPSRQLAETAALETLALRQCVANRLSVTGEAPPDSVVPVLDATGVPAAIGTGFHFGPLAVSASLPIETGVAEQPAEPPAERDMTGHMIATLALLPATLLLSARDAVETGLAQPEIAVLVTILQEAGALAARAVRAQASPNTPSDASKTVRACLTDGLFGPGVTITDLPWALMTLSAIAARAS